MDDTEASRLREARRTFNLTGAIVPAGSPVGACKTLRLKVFKSGNSLALRLPKALGLEAGMELNLEVLPNGTMELRRTEPVKRKFDIDKVWGSATSLKPIDPNDRWFAERKLDWGNSSGNKQA